MKNALEQKIKELVKLYPNDMELGRHVRKFINENSENNKN